MLDYQTPTTLAQRRARRVRIAMLIAAIVAIQAAVVLIFNPTVARNEFQRYLGGGAIGTPLAPIANPASESQAQRDYLPQALVYLAIFLLTQWLFLTPRGSWRVRLSPDGPPPLRSALAAGFIGMLLAIGLIATLMEIPDWWVGLTTENGLNSPQRFGVVWIVMAILWAFWTIMFHTYWRSLDRYTALQRVLRWLVAGTVLEMVIAAPVHAWIIYTRGDDCYCERGSWTGVAFGCTAALWLFGPGAFLLFLREKARRQQLDLSPPAAPQPKQP